jgi:hypothetical protein
VSRTLNLGVKSPAPIAADSARAMTSTHHINKDERDSHSRISGFDHLGQRKCVNCAAMQAEPKILGVGRAGVEPQSFAEDLGILKTGCLTVLSRGYRASLPFKPRRAGRLLPSEFRLACDSRYFSPRLRDFRGKL